MASSGVQVPDSIREMFNDLKLKKAYKYMIISLKNDVELIAKTGPRNATYDDFRKALKSNEACYGIYDGGKITFVHWNPDNAPVKSKMLTSTTLQAVREACTGLGATAQCANYEELDAICKS